LREVKELRELSDEELAKKVDEYKAELRRLITEINTGG
jgi:ribosomal protein L29